MSLYKKVKQIKGVIKISVEGFFIERFINLCLQKNIEIWDIERINEGTIKLKFSHQDYDDICEIANTTRCKVEILEKNGVPFVINRYKHRKIFAGLIAVVALIITILNMFIWNIEIIGDFKIPIEEVKSLLEEENIKVGMLKKDLDVDAVKLDITLKRDDIAWVGISVKGNKAIVEIVEKDLAEEDIYANTVGDIISDKAGIVDKIYVAEGTAMVNKGDVVEKGTLLISGQVSSELSGTRAVRADGEIRLRTTYVERSKIPFEKDIVTKTGNVEKSYKMKFNKYTINLINKVTNFEKYDTITEEKVFSIFGQIRTPLTLIEERFEEINVDTVHYTRNQAEELGIITNNQKLKDLIPVEAERVNYYNNVWESEEYLEVETVVQCLEKTGIYRKTGD